jgi:16S rRNA processing protein RimM
MTQPLSPTLAVGVIVRAHGIRGEVKIQPLTDSPREWQTLRQVEFTDKSGAACRRKVKQQRVQGNLVIAQIEGVYDRDQAEALRGTQLFVPREQGPVLEEGSYFIVDLIGCRVEDQSGKVLGTIGEVFQPGANDVYAVESEKGTFLLPAIRQVIRRVDIPGRRIIVDGDRLDEVAVYED